jgi:hypothetical protein
LKVTATTTIPNRRMRISNALFTRLPTPLNHRNVMLTVEPLAYRYRPGINSRDSIVSAPVFIFPPLKGSIKWRRSRKINRKGIISIVAADNEKSIYDTFKTVPAEIIGEGNCSIP